MGLVGLPVSTSQYRLAGRILLVRAPHVSHCPAAAGAFLQDAVTAPNRGTPFVETKVIGFPEISDTQNLDYFSLKPNH